MVSRDPILNAVRSGRPLPVRPVIDVHSHLGPTGGFPVPAHRAEEMIAAMDRIGIDVTICSHMGAVTAAGIDGGHRKLRRAAKAFPGRILGYVVGDPWEGAQGLRRLERQARESWVMGVKVHPSTYACSLDDPRYDSILRWAAERGLPVLTHSWADDGRCGPAVCARVAERIPDLLLILAHGLSGPAAAYEPVAGLPNVYLDTASSIPWRDAIEALVDLVGPDRVLFGTDMMFLDPGHQVGKVASAELSSDIRRRILGGNAARLFRLSLGRGTQAVGERRNE